ncbi:sugar-phosphatase [Filimonas lacunae]|uniref:Sugar-phosphatase n=1 Tax=Filimonas lacunae TaxID=477680 RepID=A0A173ML54_9BACT|nr:HAD-IA family hydrolase [Filimonas lacunae]BAV08363.1 2-deoxyglucose-6-phosphate hydrolase YniC [Filimonas lacunae]SIT33459.1 sugar-phosphatase [Filimonas lacunae]
MKELFYNKKAVIFDMDGVVIDSEGFWSTAEREVFTSLGVTMTEEDCQLTRTMTMTEASLFWFAKYPWAHVAVKEVEQMVIARVMELIKTTDCEIAYIREFIQHLKSKGFKIGLATNSPAFFIPLCLERAGIAHLFDVVSSAEQEANSKPHPDVYLTTARKLQVLPEECVVIEDSYHGIQAGKKAGMTVIGFSNGNSATAFDIADGMLHCYPMEGWL